jgi:hypothetical protein
LLLIARPPVAEAQTETRGTVLGIRISGGGRYDNVRKCIASSAGTKGGPAADVYLFAELELRPNLSLAFGLPVMRPILFAAAFEMLQLEPDVTLSFRLRAGEKTDFIVGPSLGISLHYGPDYTSESSGVGRGPSFFALGPSLGAYLGLDFKRQSRFNFQLGLRPYVTPLFAVSDPASHRGVVVGAMLEGQLRFARRR